MKQAIANKRITASVLNSTSERFITVKKCDAMKPEFMEGDLLRIEMGRACRPGDFVIFRHLELKVDVLRQLKLKRGKSYFHALNPEHGDIQFNQDKHKIIGTVVGKTRNVGRFQGLGVTAL